MPFGVRGPRPPAPSHSCGRAACGVAGACPQVPVEAAGGLEADPHDPLPARLAPDPDLPVQEPQVAAGRIAGVVADTLSLIHISESTRLGMISYAVFCLKKKKKP